MKKKKPIAKKSAKKPTQKTAKKKVVAKKIAKKPAPKLAAKKTAKKSATKTAKKASIKPTSKFSIKAVAKQSNQQKIKFAERMFHPLNDRVLVLQNEEATRTAGGLYIPNSATEKPYQGRVVAVGKGTLLKKGSIRPMDVKVGDEILFGKYSGTEVIINDQPLLIVAETEILGVIV